MLSENVDQIGHKCYHISMDDLTFTKEEQVQLTKHAISGVILFGSQAQGIANATSDYDVFILGKKSENNYDLLYTLLSEKIHKLTDIDIVFDTDAPMELKNHVAKYGLILFEQNHNVFPNFRQQVMLTYADFAPYRKMFQEATLSRIAP